MTESLFPINDDDLLIAVYRKQGRTLDDLPYTDDFEAIYAAMYGPEEGEAFAVSKGRVIHRLQNLRKAGKLPRLGRAQTAPPRIEPEQEVLLVMLVEDEIGQLSKRDQLLYQPAFDQVVDKFNGQTGLSLSHHDLWRIVAKLAK